MNGLPLPVDLAGDILSLGDGRSAWAWETLQQSLVHPLAAAAIAEQPEALRRALLDLAKAGRALAEDFAAWQAPAP